MALSQRLFLALRPGPAARARYRERHPRLARAAPGVRWIDDARLHLTLRFFGEVDEDRARATADALAAAPLGADLALGFGGLGQFPPRGRARVLWVGLAGDLDALAALAGVAEAVARELGYSAERRPFAAHVTLARLRGPADAAAARAALRGVDLATAPEPIGEIALYRSTLAPSGAAYDVVRRYPLR